MRTVKALSNDFSTKLTHEALTFVHAHAQYQQAVVAEHGVFSAIPDYLAHKSYLSCLACHARHAILHPLLRLQVSLARSINVMKEISFKM